MSRSICFDPVSGASGDMLLAALFDLGADPDAVAACIRAGGLDGFAIRFERRACGHGIMCGWVTVDGGEPAGHGHDHAEGHPQSGAPLEDHNHTHAHDHGDEIGRAHV